MRPDRLVAWVLLSAMLAGCGPRGEETAPSYESATVERRDVYEGTAHVRNQLAAEVELTPE